MSLSIRRNPDFNPEVEFSVYLIEPEAKWQEPYLFRNGLPKIKRLSTPSSKPLDEAAIVDVEALKSETYEHNGVNMIFGEYLSAARARWEQKNDVSIPPWPTLEFEKPRYISDMRELPFIRAECYVKKALTIHEEGKVHTSYATFFTREGLDDFSWVELFDPDEVGAHAVDPTRDVRNAIPEFSILKNLYRGRRTQIPPKSSRSTLEFKLPDKLSSSSVEHLLSGLSGIWERLSSIFFQSGSKAGSDLAAEARNGTHRGIRCELTNSEPSKARPLGRAIGQSSKTVDPEQPEQPEPVHQSAWVNVKTNRGNFQEELKDMIFLFSLLTLSNEETVTVSVGSGEPYHTRNYLLPKKELCAHSSFFKAALFGDFKEAKQKRIELPEEEPHTFDLYVHWLKSPNLDWTNRRYAHRYANDPVRRDLEGKIMGLAKLYSFADRLDIPILRKLAINLIMRSWVMPIRQFVPPRELIEYAYQHTSEGSGLRRYVSEYFGHAMKYGKAFHPRKNDPDREYLTIGADKENWDELVEKGGEFMMDVFKHMTADPYASPFEKAYR